MEIPHPINPTTSPTIHELPPIPPLNTTAELVVLALAQNTAIPRGHSAQNQWNTIVGGGCAIDTVWWIDDELIRCDLDLVVTTSNSQRHDRHHDETEMICNELKLTNVTKH